LCCEIARTAPLSGLIDHEMAPGKAVDGWVSLRVDVWGKVRGVGALHVVDASILPDIPSAPTNLTTIMVAERIAAKLSA